MYGCDSWTVRMAECRRIDAFELWCWRRLLRIPWTARRSNQSIPKEISPGVHWKDWCWSWNSSTLATWCKELTRLKRLWCRGRLKTGREGDDRGWDGWMASVTQWTWVWVNFGSCWWTGRPGVLSSMQSERIRGDWVTELKCSDTTSQVKMNCHELSTYIWVKGNYYLEISCIRSRNVFNQLWWLHRISSGITAVATRFPLYQDILYICNFKSAFTYQSESSSERESKILFALGRR